MRLQAVPRWDEKNRRWQLNAQKNGVRKSFYSSNPKPAGRAEVKLKRDLWLDGFNDKSTYRFERAWGLYMDDIRARTSKINSFQRDKVGRLYVLPRLGMKRISSISDQDWQDCISKAKGEKGQALSRKSLSNIRDAISGFCRFARKSRMIERLPIELLIPKYAPHIGKTILQPDQLKVLFEPSGEWYINSWRLMVVLGLRPGEAYGLQKNDIKCGVLRVRRSLSIEDEITPGKNKNARRDIKLHSLAQEIVSEQLLQISGIDTPWLFCRPDGDVPRPKLIYLHWQKYASIKGLKASPYGLRHTFVSLAKNDLPPELLKNYVGHSAAMNTFGVYGHNVDGEMDRTANLLDAVFNNTLK